MRVTRLVYFNFKGHNGSWDLAPVTIITGPNFTSKTTIPLALRLGMAGYLPPPIGTRDIYSLAGDPDAPGSMFVEIITDTGRKIFCKWTRTADGKVTKEGGVAVDIAMPELLLEPRLFFAKTAAERISTIFNVCKVEEFSFDKVKARLQEIQVMPQEYRDKGLEEINQLINATKQGTIQERITRVLNSLAVWAKEARDEAKRAQASFGGFRKAISDSVDSIIPKDVTAELAAARQEWAEACKQQTSPELQKCWQDYNASTAALEAFRPSFASLPVLEDAIAKAKTEQVTIDTDDEGAQETIDDLLPKIGTLEAKYEPVRMEVEHLKRQHDEIESAEVCPFCDNKKKGWKAPKLEQLKSKITEKIAQRDDLEQQLMKARQTVATYREYFKARNKLQTLEEHHTIWTGLLKAQHLAKCALDAVPNPEKPDTSALEQRIAKLQVDDNAWVVHQADRKRKEQLERDDVRNGALALVYAEAAKIIADEQGKLINKAFAGVLKVARNFTDGLLNSPIEMTDGKLGRRVSQRDQNTGNVAPIGAWIPFQTFSGSEEVLALAGFSVALAGDAPIKLVVLDEMGRMDAQRRGDVALRMLSLTESGVIDQAILIDVDKRLYATLERNPGIKLLSP